MIVAYVNNAYKTMDNVFTSSDITGCLNLFIDTDLASWFWSWKNFNRTFWVAAAAELAAKSSTEAGSAKSPEVCQ